MLVIDKEAVQTQGEHGRTQRNRQKAIELITVMMTQIEHKT